MIKLLIVRILGRLTKRQEVPLSFLIPAYTGLGNFIMMTPMIGKLRELCPSAKLYLLAGNNFGTEHVLATTGIVDDIFLLDERSSLLRKVMFFLRLRALRIGTAFIPFNASPSFFRLGVLLAAIPRRIGHTTEALRIPMGWTRDAMTDQVPVRIQRHESDLHFDLLEVLFPAIERAYSTIIATADSGRVLRKYGLENKNYVALQVSASNGERSPKVWPLENFQRLIERIHKVGLNIVLLGDKREQAIVNPIIDDDTISVMNLVGETTFEEVATIIKCAHVLVCHDSGLMHIGNSVETPLVALYGPTDHAYTRPRAKTSLMIRQHLPCAPCMANFAKTEQEAYQDCPINFECMRKISVDEVFEVVMKQALLRGTTRIGAGQIRA